MATHDMTVSAAYGESKIFALTLRADGTYVYRLSGDEPPLFPLAEMGEWSGEAKETVERLRREIPVAMSQTVTNAPTAPDSAYVYVGAAGDKRLYGLYRPPQPWAPIQSEILSLVNQAWLPNRRRTVAVEGQWEPPLDGKPRASMRVRSTGSEPVTVSDPSKRALWSAQILPRHLDPQGLSTYPVWLGPDELTVVATAAPTSEVALQPGAVVTVDLLVERSLPPGRYGVYVAYRSLLRAKEREHASGSVNVAMPELVIAGRR